MKAKFLPTALALFSAAAFYLCSAPRFLQGGDTAEMVAGARALLVVHPPGYPLWIRMLNLWMQIFPFDTAFWRASVLTALIAVAILALIAAVLKARPVLAAALILATALSPAVLNSAILPDVFALHGLFTAVLAAIFLFAPEGGVLRLRVLPFVFALAFAHHPTVIFLLPLLIHEFVAVPRVARGGFSAALAAGAFLSATLYLSLLTLNTASPFSWGELSGPVDVVKHALRVDYGTFQLKAKSSGLSSAAYLDFLEVSVLPFVLFVFATAFVAIKGGIRTSNRFRTFAATFALTSGFFLIANVKPNGLGAEVLLRFQLMPLLLLIFACIWVWRQEGLSEKVQYYGVVALLPALLWLGMDIRPALQMRNDSVTEDFANNALIIAEKHKPTLILADDDAAFFAMRALMVARGTEGIAVAEKSLFFHPWFYSKTKMRLPEFTLLDAKLVHLTKQMNVVHDLFEPNAGVMRIMAFSGFQDGKQFEVEFQALGRLITAGQGQKFNSESLTWIQRRSRYNKPPRGPQAFSRGRLDSMYSHYYLTQSIAASSKEEALAASQEALIAVPYAAPARKNICALAQDAHCEDQDLGSEFF